MKSFNDYFEKYGKLALRERLLLLVAVAAALYFVFDALLLAPQQKRIKQLNESAQMHRQEKDALVAQLAVLEANRSKAVDLVQSQRNEMAALQKQIAAAEFFYSQPGEQRSSGLGTLLHELLASNPRVALAGLKTQPTSVFFAPAAPAAGNKAAQPGPESKNTVYRSGIEVSLKGSFAALLTYLQALERRSDRTFWANARLDVAAYPEAVLRLDIATLGSEVSAPLN